jgi:hypothetical protein
VCAGWHHSMTVADQNATGQWMRTSFVASDAPQKSYAAVERFAKHNGTYCDPVGYSACAPMSASFTQHCSHLRLVVLPCTEQLPLPPVGVIWLGTVMLEVLGLPESARTVNSTSTYCASPQMTIGEVVGGDSDTWLACDPHSG